MSIFHNIYEGTDKPSLFAYFALRQVCQRFRRLTQDEAFDSHLFSDKGCCELCVGSSGVWAGRSPTLTNLDLPLTREKHCFGYKAKERGICLQGLEHLVRKGKTCYTCQKGFDARKRKGLSLKCKFAPRHYLDWSYCISCLVLHPLVCFSDGKKFACLAKTGYIRLCEHKVIDWYFVQQFVNGRDSPSNQSRKFEIMRCEDPSHYSPCSNGLGGPKAEMITYATATGGGLLLLTFTGNSDPDLAPDQSICDVSYGMNYQIGTMNLPMRVIEEAVRSVREKGGKHFAPERISGVLPELSAFNLEDVSTDSPSEDGRVKVIHPKDANPRISRSSPLHDNLTQGSVRITAGPCTQSGSKANHSCIAVRYQRSIRVGWPQISGKLLDENLPSHDWFHAISRESYTYRGSPGVAETCHDKDCQNSYAISSSRLHSAPSEVELSRRQIVTASDMRINSIYP